MNNGSGLKPFTCYFCNKSISNETEQGHRATCGALLEPCPYKCGAYIQRKLKNKHMTECTNKTRTLSSSSSNNSGNVVRRPHPNLEEMRRNRYSIDGERFSSNNHEETLAITHKLQKLEQLFKNVTQNFSFFKERHDGEVHNQQTLQIQNRLELEKLQYQQQTVQEWKKLIESKLDNVKSSVVPLDAIRREIFLQTQKNNSNNNVFDDFKHTLHQLIEDFERFKVYVSGCQQENSNKIVEVNDFFIQENAATAGLWNDQRQAIALLEERVNNLQFITEEQQGKIATLSFDVRAAMNIASEAAERLEISERLVEKLQAEINQAKFDVEILEDAKSSSFSSKPGVFLWKISNFNRKLQASKEEDTVLKSPVFYTDYYGYKIRLIVYLNGIKKWKGRHLILGIHVLSGEYDALLSWPCNIEAKVVLRDLSNTSNPKNYSKFICAKRKEGGEESDDPQESSNEYIFIPHTTITKSDYLKDDTVFLEVRINNSANRRQEETNL